MTHGNTHNRSRAARLDREQGHRPRESRTGWARRGSGRQQPVAVRRQHKVLNNMGTYLGTYYRDTDAWEIYWGGITSTEKKLASPTYSRNKYD